MPHNLAVFKTAKLLTLSAAGTAASAASISAQLGQTHEFFYLQLPLWFLYVAMIILTFAGAFLSLTTDYMRARGTFAGKFTTAIVVGLVISFVFLPAIIKEPSAGLMMITSFVGGLSGTILAYVFMRLIGNKELQNAVIDLIVQRAIKFLGVVLDLLADHAAKLLSVAMAGVVASFVILPQLKDNIDVKVIPSQPYQEVDTNEYV